LQDVKSTPLCQYESVEDGVFEYLQVKMLEMFHLMEDVHGQVNNVVVAQVQGGQQGQNLGIRTLCIKSQNQIITVARQKFSILGWSTE
jgi:hypothetical protein